MIKIHVGGAQATVELEARRTLEGNLLIMDHDIIDIVLIINCLLDGDNSCACADLNYDGQVNVLDIILIVNIIINN